MFAGRPRTVARVSRKGTSFPAKRGSAQQIGELTPSSEDLYPLLLDMGCLAGVGWLQAVQGGTLWEAI